MEGGTEAEGGMDADAGAVAGTEAGAGMKAAAAAEAVPAAGIEADGMAVEKHVDKKARLSRSCSRSRSVTEAPVGPDNASCRSPCPRVVPLEAQPLLVRVLELLPIVVGPADKFLGEVERLGARLHEDGRLARRAAVKFGLLGAGLFLEREVQQ